jgi:hypothetical protein
MGGPPEAGGWSSLHPRFASELATPPDGTFTLLRLPLRAELADAVRGVEPALLERRLIENANAFLRTEFPRSRWALSFQVVGGHPVVNAIVGPRLGDGAPAHPEGRPVSELSDRWASASEVGLRIADAGRSPERQAYQTAAAEVKSAMLARIEGRLSQEGLREVLLRADAARDVLVASQGVVGESRRAVHMIVGRLEGALPALSSRGAVEVQDLVRRSVVEATGAGPEARMGVGTIKEGDGIRMWVSFEGLESRTVRTALEQNLALRLESHARSRGWIGEWAGVRFVAGGATPGQDRAPIVPSGERAREVARAEGLGDDVGVVRFRLARGGEILERFNFETRGQIVGRAVQAAFPGIPGVGEQGQFAIERNGPALEVKVLVPRAAVPEGDSATALVERQFASEVYLQAYEHGALVNRYGKDASRRRPDVAEKAASLGASVLERVGDVTALLKARAGDPGRAVHDAGRRALDVLAAACPPQMQAAMRPVQAAVRVAQKGVDHVMGLMRGE